MNCRVATVMDLWELTEMEWEYAQEVGIDLEQFSKGDAYRYLVGELQKPTCKAFVVQGFEGQYEGFSLAYHVKLRWYGEPVFQLDHTYVRKEFRQVGAYRRHLEALKAAVKALGVNTIYTLWSPQVEAERVDVGMRRSGWSVDGTFYRMDI